MCRCVDVEGPREGRARGALLVAQRQRPSAFGRSKNKQQAMTPRKQNTPIRDPTALLFKQLVSQGM